MRFMKMKQKIDNVLDNRKETDLSDGDYDLDDLVDKPAANEISALDSLLYENGESKQNGIFLQALREKMVAEKSEFKPDNRSHNMRILQSDNQIVLYKALCGQNPEDIAKPEEDLPPTEAFLQGK